MNAVKTKKAESTKKCVTKRKLKFKNYKNRLEDSQLENKINQLEETQVNTKSHRQNYKLILKTQKKFKSESHSAFTEEINKIPLNLNDDKKIQSIDSRETYTYGTSKGLIC